MWTIPLIVIGTVTLILVLLRAALLPQEPELSTGRDAA
jgi:hypothetical protein